MRIGNGLLGGEVLPGAINAGCESLVCRPKRAGLISHAKKTFFIIGICLSFVSSGNVIADSKYASKERATIARAHMSRARALLVEALAEFEESRKYARPDLLIDSEDWRLRVVSLTEQLNRVIDPRPRVTREGAVFRAPPRLVKRERDELPPVTEPARSRSDYGERERMRERQEARARFYEGVGSKEEPVAVAKAGSGKISMPEEFNLPEIPVEKKSSASEGKMVVEKGKGQVVFPDELMPDTSGKTQDLKEKSEKPSVDSKLIDAVGDSKATQPVYDDDEQEYDDEEDFVQATGSSPSGANETGSSAPKGNAADRASFTALPGIINDDEVGNISPEVAERQLTEDEELTRRLEESISKRLRDK
ncbi:MAG TPA: hypothetical protein PKA63_13155 [Oligoflexia bacterium]|nr:hypothetical protein [Oligoflexia bacterium]HMP49608.1 hypothetical protein [Oligoflexia bacterium]